MAERRPIATRETGWAKALAARLSRTGLSANAISVLSMVFAMAAGAALLMSDSPAWRAWLVLAALGIQLRLLCNMLDGMVAVEHGRATPEGALYNDVPDRIADIVILVAAGHAVAAGAWDPMLGWAAAVLATFTAYVRVLGAALGTPQFFIGPQSKSQRMAVLTGAALIGATMPSPELAGRVLTVALTVVLVGSTVTVVRRVLRIARELRSRAA
jgi:phosphatidylglycerophosphate synthase